MQTEEDLWLFWHFCLIYQLSAFYIYYIRSELLLQLERTQQEKKDLQLELHTFEQNFMKRHGR